MQANTLQKILYVEDDPSIQIVAQLALHDVGGFEVMVCSSGREALAQAEAFSPDLLLLDVMMPEMDGPTTLQELRKIPSLQQTPSIFMTAKVQSHEVSELKSSTNAIAVIAKPFDPMALAGQIRDAWSGRSA